MRGTVILVTADHAASVTAVLGELAVAAHELASDGVSIDVLLVDAGSSDGGVEAAREATRGLDLHLDVIQASGADAWTTQRDGFAHALKQGAPEFVVTLDPAGHHDARQLPDLIRSFRAKGSGLTIGSRWLRGGSAPGTSLPRSLLSRLASFLVARVTGLRRVSDVTTSFRVIRPDAADLVATSPASTSDYGFYCEFVAAAQAYGFTVDEVPITFRPRFADVPPLRLHDLARFWADLRRIRGRIKTIRAEMIGDQATWAARSGRMRSQAPESGSEFGALEELTELTGAGNFTDWIVDAFDDHIGDRVLEVGAGLGAISRKIAERHPDRLVLAIEPAGNVFDSLVERCAELPNLDARQITSGDLVADAARQRFDTVLYVNVLEHIEHDGAELRTAADLLDAGGRLGVFVPAMPSLYGSLDFKSGHFRRYSAGQLRELLETAGFVDVDVRYFDLLGVAPYWVMYRLFDVSRLDRVSSLGYDRIVVPMSRGLQRLVRHVPRGKNLVATARRPA
jgi:2-polyprenyl-3-methyl-5-hydroxy-6-metoxy-1,4-benzoquinol methylase